MSAPTSPPLTVLRGTSSLSPVQDAAFAARFFGRPTSECVGVFPDPTSWATITAMPTWVQNMSQAPLTQMVLDLPMIPNSGGTNAQGAAGAYDAQIIAFAKALAANPAVKAGQLIRVGREQNGTWYKWTAVGDPADYVAYFRRIYDLLHAYAPSCLVGWCTTLGTSAGFNVETAYPGDDKTDWIGSDVYDYAWANPTATPEARWTLLRSEPYGLDWLAGFAATHQKIIVLPEVGLCGIHDTMAGGAAGGGGGDNPLFVYRLWQWAVANNVYAVLWLSTNSDTGNTHDLTAYPNAAALAEALWGAPVVTAAGLTAAQTPDAPQIVALTQQLAVANAQVASLAQSLTQTTASLAAAGAQVALAVNARTALSALLAPPGGTT